MRQTLRSILAATTVCILVAGCPGPMRSNISEEPGTRADSVLVAGRGLVRLVFYVDKYRQVHGRLPSDLTPILASSERAAEQHADIWGRDIRFRPLQNRFELRSAGPDGIFETADDIIVLGQVGRNIPCELRDSHRVLTYEEIAPRCSNAG